MNENIAVIGCGWLGFPLAKKLIDLNYKVSGSTTSKAKLKQLKYAQISPFYIEVNSEGIQGDINSCLSNCQTLILNIPPGLRKNPSHDYVAQMKHLIAPIEASYVKHVLFISSTSVYDDYESFPLITENSPTSNSKNATQLLNVESHFQKNKNFKTTILRFSGLYAEGRHPATFLSGKTQLKNPNAPVNLIHRIDCIAIIISIITTHTWNDIFHASTTPHPTKKEYYTRICKELDLPIPQFENENISQGKIINSEKLIHHLDYDFKMKL